LLLSLFLAVMIWICLWILNLCWIEIPSVFSLALITWLLDIIPYIWPLLAAIPIAMLAFVHNWFWAMILVWVLFVLIQWVQENVFTPIVMWKQLWVNSVLILVCALLWAVILWFWWVVLSVPLAVILGLFIDDRWE
jgi:predicted PurR-regulated permease PerM